MAFLVVVKWDAVRAGRFLLGTAGGSAELEYTNHRAPAPPKKEQTPRKSETLFSRWLSWPGGQHTGPHPAVGLQAQPRRGNLCFALAHQDTVIEWSLVFSAPIAFVPWQIKGLSATPDANWLGVGSLQLCCWPKFKLDMALSIEGIISKGSFAIVDHRSIHPLDPRWSSRVAHCFHGGGLDPQLNATDDGNDGSSAMDLRVKNQKPRILPGWTSAMPASVRPGRGSSISS
ncbi:hypothetical protein PGT21_003924 [Puccinia graminis f. sp. tritici]|uniref:Uncharacterized protein n=1 Tax=Puccinia graminis f. sp. tritici TaxID=56615 RepID=A0A5B0LSN6_PUCGR|nr:hypothetical protein PGT21_003924 [Puccinia graminis f. sp. tritici]KAA1137818.1 hypothetical protein PGTUg99_022668 [Puccinia graminis f. sp. tritici]